MDFANNKGNVCGRAPWSVPKLWLGGSTELTFEIPAMLRAPANIGICGPRLSEL